MRRTLEGVTANEDVLERAGLDRGVLVKAVEELYDILDTLDDAMRKKSMMPFSTNVELTTYSAMIGNILGASLESLSNGRFLKNDPHKFPDLISLDQAYKNIEIKIALEKNTPKGHLIKPGCYLTCRYVLCDQDGRFPIGNATRGTKAYIWEMRCGVLQNKHFGESNTAGDSGKTAWVNKLGMKELKVVFFDRRRAPFADNSRTFKKYDRIISGADGKATIESARF
ncbi:hypothetical protein D3C87_1054170 [compost metagenome]